MRAAGIPRGRRSTTVYGHSVRAAGFNEAAGIPRGRRLLSLLACCMWPTRFNEAAGIPRGRPEVNIANSAALPGFNEAAGIPRGRLKWRSGGTVTVHGFNEAAGIPRGRPPDRRWWHLDARGASMRPRVFPAEDADTVKPRDDRRLQLQ